MVGVYDDAGTVVGGGSASPRDEVSELMGIGVIPRGRGRGLGTAATEALTRAALHAGVTTVFLSAARTPRRRSIAASASRTSAPPASSSSMTEPPSSARSCGCAPTTGRPGAT